VNPSVVARLVELAEKPQTDWFHLRKEDLHARSALVTDPPFASFDVVLRRDYELLSGLVVPLAEDWTRLKRIEELARSLYGGLTCAQDPMDVDERIEALGAALDLKEEPPQ
jgi:hypothetical protein